VAVRAQDYLLRVVRIDGDELRAQNRQAVGHRWMWWPSALARTPDPAPAKLGHERAAALADESLKAERGLDRV
jgi:hypothetical protein